MSQEQEACLPFPARSLVRKWTSVAWSSDITDDCKSDSHVSSDTALSRPDELLLTLLSPPVQMFSLTKRRHVVRPCFMRKDLKKFVVYY
jgi:hypothetical protein